MSQDKLDKQIEEFEEEQKKYNEMVDETIDEDDLEEINEKLEEKKEDTKEFNLDEPTEEIEEDEDTKEFEKVEEPVEEKEEEEVGKHLSKEDKELIEEEIKEQEPDKKEAKPKKKNNKKKIIIILIILIVLVTCILLAILVPPMLKAKEETKKAEKENVYTEKKMNKILTNYGEAIENVYSINKNNDNKELTFEEANKLVEFPNKIKCKTAELYKDGKLYLEECTIDGHKTKATYGEKQDQKEDAEIAEGSFYVYEKDNTYTLETPKNKDEYKAYIVDTNIANPTGIKLFSQYNTKYVFYYDDEFNVHVKNFKTNKDAVAMGGITSTYPIEIREENYDETYVGVSNGVSWGIYNLNTGLLDIKMVYSALGPNLNLGVSGPPEWINTLKDNYIAAIDSNNNYGVINYTNGEIIIPFENNAMQLSGNYLWSYKYVYDTTKQESVYSNKKIYDFDGNTYLENKYDDIFGIVEGKYILVKDKKDYKMVQIDGKTLYNYGDIKNLGNINYFIGYNQNPIFQFNKKDKTGTDENNQCIEVTYDNKTKKGGYKDYYCGGIAKPILYLYPTEKTNVKITFDHPDLLKTTYPKYDKEWNVSVDTDGTITDTNGRTYYALYWDEKQKNKVDFKTGFFVSSNNAIKFLEEKLFEIGLTEREANEFIMYWLPVLEKNKKSVVYFELTEERDKYNKINIEPQPDSILRVTIHIKKVNKDIKIKEQKIKQFNRQGFTAVEWGGVTY